MTYRIIDSLLITAIALTPCMFTLSLNPWNALNRLVFFICLWFIVRNTTARFAYTLCRTVEEKAALYEVDFFFQTTIFCFNLHFFLR